MKKISQEKRNSIIQLIDSGLSAKKIAKLHLVSAMTVGRIRNEVCPSIEKPRGGRPGKISESTSRLITRCITSGARSTAVEVARMLRNSEITDVHASTVRRTLHKNGMVARKKTQRCALDNSQADLMDKAHPRTDVMAITDSSDDSSSEEHDGSDTDNETDTESKPDQDASPGTEFSVMSFEEIINMKNKMGSKAFHKAVQGARHGPLSADSMKADKSRPLEMSSKKPVPFLRKVVPAKKRMQRDPRFDDLSGEFKPEIFEQTYSFLDNMKKKEKETLEKRLQKTRDPALREQLTMLLRRMDQQEKASKQKQRLREKEAEFKRQQRERAQQGKKPLYLKKSDIRKLELVDKYQDLKKKGKVESFLSKKRKRNSIKDRRRLPSQQ